MSSSDGQATIGYLASSRLARRFAARIIHAADSYPILDVAGGGGRHAFLLASMGAQVICLDNDLRNFDQNRRRIGCWFDDLQLKPMWADVLAEPWPFGPSILGGILDVHFLVPQLFAFFAYSLRDGAYLLLETPGGQGGNYRELPSAGSLRSALGDSFDFEFYREKKVGPPESDSVTVGLLAKKRAGR